MKPHYFSQEKPDEDDIMLELAIGQGYVPKTCLLGGMIVMGVVREARDPCEGCASPRHKCNGRPKDKK